MLFVGIDFLVLLAKSDLWDSLSSMCFTLCSNSFISQDRIDSGFDHRAERMQSERTVFIEIFRRAQRHYRHWHDVSICISISSMMYLGFGENIKTHETCAKTHKSSWCVHRCVPQLQTQKPTPHCKSTKSRNGNYTGGLNMTFAVCIAKFALQGADLW